MGEYDISQWRLAGTQIHTPSDPKMATGVRTGFTPPVLGMAGSPREPMIWDSPKSPTWRPRYAKPKRSYSPGPRYVVHQNLYPHNILGS